jgi:hypothetical protein
LRIRIVLEIASDTSGEMRHSVREKLAIWRVTPLSFVPGTRPRSLNPQSISVRNATLMEDDIQVTYEQTGL